MARKNKGEIRIVCRGDVLKPVDEIDPRYGAAIIRRWEQLTGQKAEKLD